MSKQLAISIVRVDVEIGNPSWQVKVSEQIKGIRRAAKELGVELHSTFYLLKSSPVKFKEIKEFCVFAPEIKYLIVDSPDRLSRNVDEYVDIHSDFSDIGVETYYTGKGNPKVDTSPWMLLMNEFVQQQGQVHSEIRSEITKQGMRNMVEKGLYPFKPKLGYKASKTKGFCVRDGATFELLQLAFKAVADGTLTPKEAHQWLNSRWVKASEKKPLQLSRWLHMLRDKFYAGKLRVSNLDEITGLHEPMITEEEYEDIQKLLEADDSDTQTENE